MDDKLYINVIRQINPTYNDLLTAYSRGDTRMSYLETFELVLSACLRDDILETVPKYKQLEETLHTHKKHSGTEILSKKEFRLWLKCHEQIMRDEGLLGNSGNSDKKTQSDMIGFDPFLSPAITKVRGVTVKADRSDKEWIDELVGDSGEDVDGEYIDKECEYSATDGDAEEPSDGDYEAADTEEPEGDEDVEYDVSELHFPSCCEDIPKEIDDNRDNVFDEEDEIDESDDESEDKTELKNDDDLQSDPECEKFAEEGGDAE